MRIDCLDEFEVCAEILKCACFLENMEDIGVSSLNKMDDPLLLADEKML
jgi:hypothetical protein